MDSERETWYRYENYILIAGGDLLKETDQDAHLKHLQHQKIEIYSLYISELKKNNGQDIEKP